MNGLEQPGEGRICPRTTSRLSCGWAIEPDLDLMSKLILRWGCANGEIISPPDDSNCSWTATTCQLPARKISFLIAQVPASRTIRPVHRVGCNGRLACHPRSPHAATRYRKPLRCINLRIRPRSRCRCFLTSAPGTAGPIASVGWKSKIRGQQPCHPVAQTDGQAAAVDVGQEYLAQVPLAASNFGKSFR